MLSANEFQLFGRIIFSIASSAAIVTNILLIYLVLHTHVSELNRYRRIIIQFAVFDIINCLIIITVAPVAVVIDGVEYFFQVGAFRYLPLPINHALLLLWLFFHFFSLSVVPIQFAFRYLLLCKNIMIKNSTYASLFLIPSAFALAHIVLSYAMSDVNSDFSNHTMNILQLFFESDHPKDRVIITVGQHNLSDIIFANASAFLMTVVSYLVIFYYAYKIQNFLKTYSNSFSSKTTQMHQSLNKILLIQALTPVIFLIAPTTLILFCSFTKQTTSPDFVICLTVIVWPPFINAAFTLITLKPLRVKVIKIFSKKSNKTSSSKNKLFTIHRSQRIKSLSAVA